MKKNKRKAPSKKQSDSRNTKSYRLSSLASQRARAAAAINLTAAVIQAAGVIYDHHNVMASILRNICRALSINFMSHVKSADTSYDAQDILIIAARYMAVANALKEFIPTLNLKEDASGSQTLTENLTRSAIKLVDQQEIVGQLDESEEKSKNFIKAALQATVDRVAISRVIEQASGLPSDVI